MNEASSSPAAPAAVSENKVSVNSNQDNSDLEALQAKFDAYKAKTKQWQENIRERDAAMRQQLKRSTEEITEKDAEIATLTTQLRRMEEEVNLARQQDVVRYEKSVSDARIQELTEQVQKAEEEIKKRDEDVIVMRKRVASVQDEIRALRWTASKHHVLFGMSVPALSSGMKDSPSSNSVGSPGDRNAHTHFDCSSLAVVPSFKTVVRVCVPPEHAPTSGATGYTFCVNTSEGRHCGWLPDSLLIDAGIPLLPTVDETAAAALHQAVAKAESKAKHEAELVSGQSLQNVRDELERVRGELDAQIKLNGSAEQKHKEERDAVRVEAAEEQQRALQAAEMKRAADVEAARHEVQREYQHRLDSLQEKVTELEAYRARAQLVMKQSRGSEAREEEYRSIQAQLTSERDRALEQLKAHSQHVAELELQKREADVELGDAKRRLKESESMRMESEASFERVRLQAENDRSEEINMYIIEIDSLRSALAKERSNSASRATPTVSPAMSAERVEETFPNQRAAMEMPLKETPGTLPASSVAAAVPAADASPTPTPPTKVAGVSVAIQCDLIPRDESVRATKAIDRSEPPLVPVHVEASEEFRRARVQSRDTEESIQRAGASTIVSPTSSQNLTRNASDKQFSFVEVLNALDDDFASHSLSSSTDIAQMLERLRQESRRKDSLVRRLQDEMHRMVGKEQERDAVILGLRKEIDEMRRNASFADTLTSNSGYVKNVVLKYLACTDTRIRHSLVPVLAQVLQLTDEETRQLQSAGHT